MMSDLEYIARIRCIADGINPDVPAVVANSKLQTTAFVQLVTGNVQPAWTFYLADLERILGAKAQYDQVLVEFGEHVLEGTMQDVLTLMWAEHMQGRGESSRGQSLP